MAGVRKMLTRISGEKMDADAMIVLVKWDGETPYVYFFKHGLDAEKVVSNVQTIVFSILIPVFMRDIV